jgi:hypothetical protein
MNEVKWRETKLELQAKAKSYEDVSTEKSFIFCAVGWHWNVLGKKDIVNSHFSFTTE